MSTSWLLRHCTTSSPNPRCFANHIDHPLSIVACLSAHPLKTCTIETVKATYPHVTATNVACGTVAFREPVLRFLVPNDKRKKKAHRSESWDHNAPLQKSHHWRTPKTRGPPISSRDKNGQDVGKFLLSFLLRCTGASLNLAVTTVG